MLTQFNPVLDASTLMPRVSGTAGDLAEIASGGVLADAEVTPASFDPAGSAASVQLAAEAFASNASHLSSGTVATARLGSGTASSSTYLRGDQTWAAAGGGSTPTLAEILAQGDDADGYGLTNVDSLANGDELWAVNSDGTAAFAATQFNGAVSLNDYLLALDGSSSLQGDGSGNVTAVGNWQGLTIFPITDSGDNPNPVTGATGIVEIVACQTSQTGNMLEICAMPGDGGSLFAVDPYGDVTIGGSLNLDGDFFSSSDFYVGPIHINGSNSLSGSRTSGVGEILTIQAWEDHGGSPAYPSQMILALTNDATPVPAVTLNSDGAIFAGDVSLAAGNAINLGGQSYIENQLQGGNDEGAMVLNAASGFGLGSWEFQSEGTNLMSLGVVISYYGYPQIWLNLPQSSDGSVPPGLNSGDLFCDQSNNNVIRSA